MGTVLDLHVHTVFSLDSPVEPEKYLEQGRQHRITETAVLETEQQVMEALGNLHFISFGSDLIFQKRPDSKGFFRPESQRSGHAQAIIGYQTRPTLHFFGLNSWADYHERVRDFETGVDLPVGSFRFEPKWLNYMLRYGEVIAAAGFQGFVARRPEHYLI